IAAGKTIGPFAALKAIRTIATLGALRRPDGALATLSLRLATGAFGTMAAMMPLLLRRVLRCGFGRSSNRCRRRALAGRCRRRCGRVAPLAAPMNLARGPALAARPVGAARPPHLDQLRLDGSFAV